MRKRRSIQPGFTLLEILLALALVGMALTTLSVSLFTAFRAQRSIQNISAEARRGRPARSALERDLWCAAPPTGVLAGAFMGYDERRGILEADRLSFYTTTDPTRPASGGSDLAWVLYRLISTGELLESLAATGFPQAAAATLTDDREGLILVRETVRQLLASESIAPTPLVLARGVERFNLRYYDGVQWLDTWDSTTRENELPQAVEITLQLAGNGTPRDPMGSLEGAQRSIVPLPGAPAIAGGTPLSLLP